MATIRLWLIDLDRPPQAPHEHWLSRTEQERAARLVFAQDARRYRASHVALRRLLWQECGFAANAEFEIDAMGKPGLGPAAACGFNLSHSGAFALVGIGPVDGVGVDIEVLRPVGEVWALAEQHFNANEREALRRCVAADVMAAFLRVWTRKEACLKAVGCGLSVAAASFEVGLEAQARALALVAGGRAVDVDVQSLDLGAGILAAVARSCHPARVGAHLR